MSGIDMGRDWQQRVSARTHFTAATFGTGCVTALQVLGSRVYAADLFGSLSVYECVWLQGSANASLVPLAVDRTPVWSPAFCALSHDHIIAAGHPFSLLHLKMAATHGTAHGAAPVAFPGADPGNNGDNPGMFPGAARGGRGDPGAGHAPLHAFEAVHGFPDFPLLPTRNNDTNITNVGAGAGAQGAGAVAASVCVDREAVAEAGTLALVSACNVRQAAVRLVRMRLGPALPGPCTAAAFVTAGGAVGCVRLEDPVAAAAALRVSSALERVYDRPVPGPHSGGAAWALPVSPVAAVAAANEYLAANAYGAEVAYGAEGAEHGVGPGVCAVCAGSGPAAGSVHTHAESWPFVLALEAGATLAHLPPDADLAPYSRTVPAAVDVAFLERCAHNARARHARAGSAVGDGSGFRAMDASDTAPAQAAGRMPAAGTALDEALLALAEEGGLALGSVCRRLQM